MRIVVAIIGVTVSLGLIGVSIMMNFRFGLGLGKTELDGLIYGLASACADGFKVILPFTMVWAWGNRRLLAAIVSIVLFIVFSAYSVTSSLGFSATNRAETSNNRIKQVTSYNDLRNEYDYTLARRNQLSAFRPKTIVKEIIRARQQHKRWTGTSGCTDVTLDESRLFCDEYFKLKAEINVSVQAEKYAQKLDKLSKRLSSFTGQTQSADPQVEILKEVLGVPIKKIEIMLTVILTLLVEFGSGFGLFVTFGHGQKPSKTSIQSKMESRDELWWEKRVVSDPESAPPVIALYRNYCEWNQGQGIYLVKSISQFKSWLVSEQGSNLLRVEGRDYCAGVNFRAEKIL